MALDGELVYSTKIDEKGIEDGLKSIDSKVSNDGFSIGKGIFANLGAEAIKAAAGALGDAAEVGMDFEASMSKVGAVSSATGVQLEHLTELAREYGAATVFSSSECADALNYMAQAGWNTQQMAEGLPGVLNLAASSGEDLAMVADIVTDSLTAFKMTAEDSAHFSDVLAAAAAASNTNVAMMGETFKYVAPVAGTLGYSCEDVAVAVGLMANSGIKASQAGTSLRAILSNLTEPTDKQREALEKLGISLTDSSGNMKSLDELMSNFRSSLSQLSEAEQASYASIIGGQEAMSGLLAIVNASDTDFTKLKSAIYDCDGACDEMSATMTDNLSGGLKELSSAAEDTQIEFYNAIKPMAEDALPGFKEILVWLKDNAGSIGNALKPVGTALQLIFALLKPIGALLSPILKLAGGIASGISNVVTAVFGLDTIVEDYDGTMAECRAEIESTENALQKAKEKYGENSEEAQELTEQLEKLSLQYEKGGGNAEVYSEKLEDLTTAYEDMQEAYKNTIGEIDDSEDKGLAAVSTLSSLSEQTSLTTGQLELMAKQADYLNREFDCDIKVNLDTGEIENFDPETVMQEIADKVNASKQTAAIDFLTGDDFTSNYMETVEAYENVAKEAESLQKTVDRMGDSYGTTEWEVSLADINTDNISQLAKLRSETEAYEKTIAELEDEIAEYGKQAGWTNEITRAYIDSMKNAAINGDEFVRITDESAEQLSEQEVGIEAARAKMEEYSEAIGSIAEEYDNAYEAAYNSISGQYGLFDTAQADMEATTEAAKNALDSQIAYWQSYNDNLDALRQRSIDSLGVTQEQLDTFLAMISDGSEEHAGLLADMKNASDEKIGEIISAYTEILPEEQKELAEKQAELLTDAEQRIKDLSDSMKEEVDAMDLSNEANRSRTYWQNCREYIHHSFIKT